jgi:hypothetical protein
VSPLVVQFERLLRRPLDIAEEARTGRPDVTVFLAALCAIVLGAGLYGAALASSRGGLQIAYAALKLPIACLLTIILVVPALAATSTTLRRPLSLSGASVLMLAAAGRAALVLLALAPVVWLAFDQGLAYHRGIIVASLGYGLAGLSALGMLRFALGRDLRSLFVIGCFGLVFLPAGGQTAWLFRPYVGRPSQDEVPFMRSREGSFGAAVQQSLFSSVEAQR